MNRRVVAVVYDQLCTFEFGVACELFGLPRPELEVPWYDFSTVSIDPPPLKTWGGMTMAASQDLGALASAGTIVLPGWRSINEPPPKQLLSALIHAHANGARIMSICSGVFIVAATGLLDGQAATTHWRYTKILAARYPNIMVQPDVLYVDNGPILTSAGSAAGIDLGLHLIGRDYGANIANQVARRLVLPTHRDGGQAQFIDNHYDPVPGSSLAPVLDALVSEIHLPLAVSDMARRASMSPRTFARRFRNEVGITPHRWLVKQRIAAARRLLETTEFPIDQIAVLSGHPSPATFRHHFRAEVRTTPTAYRRAHRQNSPNGPTKH